DPVLEQRAARSAGLVVPAATASLEVDEQPVGRCQPRPEGEQPAAGAAGPAAGTHLPPRPHLDPGGRRGRDLAGWWCAWPRAGIAAGQPGDGGEQGDAQGDADPAEAAGDPHHAPSVSGRPSTRRTIWSQTSTTSGSWVATTTQPPRAAAPRRSRTTWTRVSSSSS